MTSVVQLEHTLDGGRLVSGTNELFSAVYMSLFGGNLEDSGRPTDPLTWWANRYLSAEKQRRSETQFILLRAPAITESLTQTLTKAIERDIAWIPGAKLEEVTLNQILKNYIDLTVNISNQSFNFRGELI